MENTVPNKKEGEMPSRSKKSLAQYFSVFFSAVLIVLIIASYSQGQQLETTKKDLQSNSSALESLQQQYSALELQLKDSSSKVEELTKYQQSARALLLAQNCYHANDLAGLKRNLDQVDSSVLSGDELNVYNYLKGKEQVSEHA